MHNRRLVHLHLLSASLLAIGCGHCQSDPELVTASVELQSLSSCIVDPWGLRDGSKVSITVKGFKGASRYNKPFEFEASDDTTPGILPIRFEIEVPKSEPFELSFTASSPGCEYCSECWPTCEVSSQITNKGRSGRYRHVQEGELLAPLYVDDTSCNCQDNSCRVSPGGRKRMGAGGFGGMSSGLGGEAGASSGGMVGNSGGTGTGGTGDDGDCPRPHSHLVAFWPADGNAEDVIAGNDGVMHGAAHAESPGVRGAAFSLGSDSYVEVADDAALNFSTGDFSISYWINTTETLGTRVVLDKRYYEGGSHFGYHAFIVNGQPGFQLANGPHQNFDASANVADGQWHHVFISVSRSAADGIRFYVDGNEVGTADPRAYAESLDNSAPLRFGTRSFELTGFIDALIDDVQLYDAALSPDAVSALADGANACDWL